jgi:hypothetical protein
MLRLPVTLLLAVALMLSSLYASAQQKPAQDPSATEQIAILKAQLKAQEDFQDSILSTVYWALGVSTGIAIFLIGFSWFNNRGMHERDVSSIRNELLVELRKQQDSARDTIAESVEVKTMAALEAELSKIRTSIDVISGRNKKTRIELDYLKHTTEIRHWTALDVQANVLTSYMALLNTAITDQDDYEIAEALAGIRATLPKLDTILASEIPEIVAALEKLPTKHATHIEPIKKILAQIKTY